MKTDQKNLGSRPDFRKRELFSFTAPRAWLNLQIVLLAILSPLSVTSLLAADSGNEVIVIYNSKVPESRQVAEYYAQRRHVPQDQLFGFALSTGAEMSRAEFRDSLQKPLAAALKEKKLWQMNAEMVPASNSVPARIDWKVRQSKIRYAVICYGVPWRIARDVTLKETPDVPLRPEFDRNEACVDNDLALLPSIENHLLLAGPLANRLYNATNEAAFYPSNGLLMVTRLDGPSADIARGLVDKAIAAETNGLWGRAYIDTRNISDPGYGLGDEWLNGAAEICRRLGFETVVDTNAATFPPEFPMSQIAFYAGWYDGQVSGPFTPTNVEFMPGAFAYHLHSFSAANIRSASENWVGPLLSRGATITMGSVTEPFLGGTPDITSFAARLIYFGFNFGEAAYASQTVVSWQTVVIGDPLYRPFAIPAAELHAQLQQRKSPWLEWSFLRLMNLNLVKGLSPFQISAELEQIEITKRSAILTEKLGDLYSGQGKPSSAVEMWERALNLSPSPQQRVRLRLNLADKLAGLDRTQDALSDLDALLKETPAYPAKAEIYRRLIVLAKKLAKGDVVRLYEERLNGLAAAGK